MKRATHFIVRESDTIIETKPTRTVTITMPRGADIEAHFQGALGSDGLNGWFRDAEILEIWETTPWWAWFLRPWYDYQEFEVAYNIIFRAAVRDLRQNPDVLVYMSGN